MTWNFETHLQRFDVGDNGEAWQHVVVPPSLAKEVHASGHSRFVVTLNGTTSWHCAVNVTCEADHQEAGISFLYVAKHHMKAAGLEPGAEVQVKLTPDVSKYGMDVHPELQEMLDEDAAFLAKFDAMLPGKRRGHLVQINKAKSPETVAKRIAKLMTDLGLSLLFGSVLIASSSGCAQPQFERTDVVEEVRLGNERTEAYLPLLEGKHIAVVGNHTSVVGGRPGATHLVDTLLSLGVNVKHVFAPEHGFRGEAANGADIQDGVDALTGLKVYSLHGKHRKPQPEQLEGLDAVVFDIQDVGARFYTYVSSLMLVMEACAAQGVDVVILDRPNPHGHHMQGPMLESEFKSFVGWIPTPMVHGMTLGELALMAAEEGWFERPDGWRPYVVLCQGWQHGDDFQLAIRPSPNLPSTASVDLYPSLCLFEPTEISVGRGTPMPFEVLGYPDVGWGSFAFTPLPTPGAAPHPKHEGKTCHGQHLVGLTEDWRNSTRTSNESGLPGFSLELLWSWAQTWRSNHGNSLDGFVTSPSFFDKLAGTDEIRKALEQGVSLTELESQWAASHREFFKRAQPHFLYAWKSPLPGREF